MFHILSFVLYLTDSNCFADVVNKDIVQICRETERDRERERKRERERSLTLNH